MRLPLFFVKKRAMRCFTIISLLLIFVLPGGADAQEGSPRATRGGTFSYNLRAAPQTLSPLSAKDYYARVVNSFMVESLGIRNMDTYEWAPWLATSWKISSDGKVFTFELRKGVHWHDGRSFTAKDVKFTFDALTDPENRYEAAHVRPFYEGIAEAKVINPYKIQFIARSQYFGNFDVLAGMGVLPEHIYKDTSKENVRKLKKRTWGSGPYKFKQFRRGKYVEMVSNPNWWGRNVSEYRGWHNYDKVRIRFIREKEMAIRRLEREELDFLELREEDYHNKTHGPKWGKSVFKVKYNNKAGKSVGSLGFNLSHKIFKNRNVRKALYHLLNREKMIEKFLYDNALLATGPWYGQSIYANKEVKPVLFDPSLAKSILKKEGWVDSDGDKILDKVIDGVKTPLSFTLMEPHEEFMKYLTMFKEDAKKAGVEILLKRIDWGSFIKLLDERKFEAFRVTWSGAVDVDPKLIWHSSSAFAGGYNFVGYKNKEVDRLIDEGRRIYDKKERAKIFKKVYRLIAEDIPYLFFFNAKSGFYSHTKKAKRIRDTYNYKIGYKSHWWLE